LGSGRQEAGLDVRRRCVHRLGTALAGGCTSGHGIFGCQFRARPSLLSTLAFMAGGIVTTQFVYRVVFGGGDVMTLPSSFWERSSASC